MSVSLRLRCKPSAALCAAVLLVHIVALACAGLVLPLLAFGWAAAGLSLSAYAHLKALRTPFDIDWRGDGIRLRDTPGLVDKLQYCKGAAPHPYWGVLHLRDGAGRIHRRILAADCADPQAFRRLRMWLRWQPSPSTPAAK